MFNQQDGTISGTPSAVTGQATYTIKSTTGGVPETCALVITIETPPAPAGLTYATQSPTYTAFQQISNDLPSSTGGPIVSYAISQPLPAGLNFDTTTGVISGTPTAASTATSYTVTASNPTGQTTDILSITVNPNTAPPTLTYSDPTAAFLEYQYITPDNPIFTGGAVQSYAISPNLPAGLTLNTATGVISGAPTVSTAATTYTVTATSGGVPTTGTLSIQVILHGDTPPSALSYAPQAVTFTVGTPITPMTPTVTGTVQGYTSTPNLPAGLSLDPLAGIISGTPSTAVATAVYTIKVSDFLGNSTTFPLTITVNPVVTASNLQLVQPLSVHPGDAWMQASVAPVQQGMAFAWSVLPGTATGTLTGTAGLDLDSFSAGTTAGSFLLQEETGGVTVSGTVNVQTGTWLVENGGPTTVRYGATSTLLPSGRVLVAGGQGAYANGNPVALASAELYDPATGLWFATGAMTTARYGHTATLLQGGTVLVAGGQDASGNALLTAEVFDPATGLWTATGSMAVARSSHTATLLGDGTVLVAGAGTVNGNPSLLTSELYDPTLGSWTPTTGNLNTARQLHTAVALDGSHVLVAGGVGTSSGPPLASAEVYSTATGTWTVTGSLKTARYSHIATVLSNGNVLVAGGTDIQYALASAEIYSTNLTSPSTATWAATGSMAAARTLHAAVQLGDGSVMVTGGFSPLTGMPVATAEIYPNGSTSWTPAGSLALARSQHTATVLSDGLTVVLAGGNGSSITPLGSSETYSGGSWTLLPGLGTSRTGFTSTALGNGTVLVAGGLGATGIPSALLFNTTTKTWSTTPGPMMTPRQYHTATLLQGGAYVLVAGGQNSSGVIQSSSELYDVQAGTWALTTSMPSPRQFHTATLLGDGTVLVAGGQDTGGTLASATLYNPATPSWNLTSSMNTARYYHTATLLGGPTGMAVLMAGGVDGSGQVTNTAEIYSAGAWTAAASLNTGRQLHTANALKDGTVLVAGGQDVNYALLASAEVYTPARAGPDTWTTSGSMAAARIYHTATLLNDGTVLVTGGDNSSGILASAEIYTPVTAAPATATWAPTAPLNAARWQHSATLLPDGTVVVGFGYFGDTVTEIFMTNP